MAIASFLVSSSGLSGLSHSSIIRLFHHYFGSSLASIILNGLVAALALVLLVRFVLMPLAELILDVIDFRRIAHQPSVFIELVPPAFTTKDPHATNQFITMLHSLLTHGSWKDRWLRRKSVLSFELVSSRDGGIRYIARLPAGEAAVFQQQLAAFLPDVRFQVVTDYLADYLPTAGVTPGVVARVMEFEQARHYAHPLASHDSLTQHDPIAYITGSMTRLAPGELVVFQLVLAPARLRGVKSIRNQLMLGKDPKLDFRARPWLVRFIVSLVWVPIKALGTILHVMTSPTASHHTKQSVATSQNSAVRAVRASQADKLSQSLFQVSVRTLVVTKDRRQAVRSETGLRTALATFHVPGYQGLVAKCSWLMNRYRLYSFRRRLLAPLTRDNCVLGVAEVASLYHFPYGLTAQPENLVASSSKTLAAPLAIKRGTDGGEFDVVLGLNKHHGSATAIGLTAAERERHVYIIGGTGNGKTTMMEYGIVQDIRAGKGVAMIDPHGDSASRLLGYIPEDRLNDVIYLNPRDLDYPVGLNILELPEGLTGSDLAHARDLVTEAVISVLRKIFDDNADSNAYRIERVLRNSIHTALTVQGATLFTVLRLLTDTAYRKQVTKTLTDESLKRFWKEEIGKAGEFQRVKISAGPITRIERFERSESARRILGQAKSTIDFDDILNSRKILICNFSKGRLGEDTSVLFGTTILAKLQLTAWRRDGIAPDDRVPFYLYVDEFQNFATESFMSLFSEARKYRLYLTMAQQSVSQLQSRTMISSILDNVGTIIAFRSKSPETESLLLHQFSPYVDPGEIGNLPSFNFYAKIAAVSPQEPLSGETLLLASRPSEAMAEMVVAASRANYGVIYQEEGVEQPQLKTNKQTDRRAEKARLVAQSVPDELVAREDVAPGLDEPAGA